MDNEFELGPPIFDSSDSSSAGTPSQSTTLDYYSLQSSSSHAIYEDHPGLNPSSERIVELSSDIDEKFGRIDEVSIRCYTKPNLISHARAF